jgi:hypothetical protein
MEPPLHHRHTLLLALLLLALKTLALLKLPPSTGIHPIIIHGEPPH